MSADDPETEPTLVWDLESRPFDEEPDYAPKFYEAIGRIVYLWGRCEYLLDMHLTTMLRIARIKGIEAEMQLELGRKVKLMRELHRKCYPDAKDKGLDHILTEIMKVSRDRNLLIHSEYEKFEDGDQPQVVIRNRRQKKGVITTRRLGATLPELHAIGQGINALYPLQFGLFMEGLTLHAIAKVEKDRAQVPPEGDPNPPTPESSESPPEPDPPSGPPEADHH